jgi:hypothetical protein
VKTTSAEYDRGPPGVALGLNGVLYTWKENDDDITFTKSHGLIFCFPSLDEMTHVTLLDTGGYQFHEGLLSLTVQDICANFSDWVEKAIALSMIDTTHSCLFCHTLIDNTTHAGCDACVDKVLKVYLESPQRHEAIMRRKTEPARRVYPPESYSPGWYSPGWYSPGWYSPGWYSPPIDLTAL